MVMLGVAKASGASAMVAQSDSENINKVRIVGGLETGPNAYPFLVLIKTTISTNASKGTSESFVCGGSLIAPGWVVTAAHCVSSRLSSSPARKKKRDKRDGSDPNEPRIVVSYGSNNRNRMKSMGIRRVIVHPQADLNLFQNDIALIELASEVKNLKPIKISSAIVYRSQPVVAVGFGVTSASDRGAVQVSRQVDLMTSDDGPSPDKEKNNLGPSSGCNMIKPGFVDNNQDVICCPVSVGKDTCFGDSGGPLIASTEGESGGSDSGSVGSENVLIGITSFGDTDGSLQYICGGAGGFGFYTHPSFFLGFITNTTGLSLQDIATNATLSRNSPTVPPPVVSKGVKVLPNQQLMPYFFQIIVLASLILAFFDK
ncbi:Chymotrypsin BII [Smittium mucronatum]|uniref:Chymotrypsin BII n=1 Tax=Smittium mucronatum TaxID=133383 RepID=A0A1R0GW78_9FUNG|nr:Chymotrypsin BII [Smittium mucronatum]